MGKLFKKGNLHTYAAKVTTVAALAAFATYLIIANVSNILINHYFSGREFSETRRDYYAESLQQFANEHQMKATDEDLLRQWADPERYLYVRIFSGGPPLAESGYTSHVSAASSEKIDPVVQTSVPITFADGTYTVVFDDYTYARYISFWQVAAAFIAFWPLLIIAVSYIRVLGKHITRLSRSAQIIESGRLDHPVPIPENATTEVQSLAICMNDMRSTLYERFLQDRDRMIANQQLLTAMSHDIRTPLTTLIGYTEILNQGTPLSEEDRKQYTSIVYNRALRLKELTDEMFFYFLVYGSSEIKTEILEYNAQIFVPQLLGDYLNILESNNVQIDFTFEDYPYTLRTDVTTLQHVFDNVFSNVRKHGDLTRPVTIHVGRHEDDYIHVTVSNYIPEISPNVESTNVGLRTCEKLMEILDGAFTHKSDDSIFTVDVAIPLVASTAVDVV